MVYTVSLKNLSFKQNLGSQQDIFADQISTYAILKYAQDLPDQIYNEVMLDLVDNIDAIYYDKLLLYVQLWKSENLDKIKKYLKDQAFFMDSICDINSNVRDDGFVLDDLDEE